MPRFLETKSLYYSDVNLIASPTDVFSRKNIPRELDHIVIAPMDAIVGPEFAIEALNLGLTVCYPRFDDIETQVNDIRKIFDKCGKEDIQEGFKDLYISIGLNDTRRLNTISTKLGHKSYLIDIANGYMNDCVSFASYLQSMGYRVMVGNVHSARGLNLYFGCKVRVGIGNGTVCQTGDVTGYNRGQITEILDCYNNRTDIDTHIIADGGIKDAGCVAKAFGAGADYAMMGGYFRNSEEAKNVINKEYKYWGGASHLQQIKQNKKVTRHSEGTQIDINKNDIKPLKDLVEELWGGISSAISYSGHANLTQFIGNGVFEIKHK